MTGWVDAGELPFDRPTTRVKIDVIRGTAADDIWLLCFATQERHILRLGFHFDGTRWSQIDLPPKTRASLWPIARDDVWAVGLQGSAAHFDGKAWTLHRAPGVDVDFLDVWARPGPEVWVAAGGPRVYRHDGVAWDKLAPPELAGRHNSVHTLFGLGDELMVPVNSLDEPSWLARHAGGRWTRDEIGRGGVVLVAGSAPDDVWAMSRRHQGFHHDGRGWTRHETSPLEARALAVVGKGEAYAVGEAGMILRWDGQAWRPEVSPTTSGLWSVYAPPGGAPIAGGDRLFLRGG